MRMSVAPRTLVVGGVCMALLGVTVWGRLPRSTRSPAASLPPLEELDSLAAYQEPVEPAPTLDEYAAFIPARIPAQSRPFPDIETAPPAPEPELRVTAILVVGARPVAIINDEAVGLGGRLPGGGSVVAIERDHVIVRAPDGTRRTLRLPAG